MVRFAPLGIVCTPCTKTTDLLHFSLFNTRFDWKIRLKTIQTGLREQRAAQQQRQHTTYTPNRTRERAIKSASFHCSLCYCRRFTISLRLHDIHFFRFSFFFFIPVLCFVYLIKLKTWAGSQKNISLLVVEHGRQQHDVRGGLCIRNAMQGDYSWKSQQEIPITLPFSLLWIRSKMFHYNWSVCTVHACVRFTFATSLLLK